ncbi:MAG TPA: 2OG-Fe(II) oxygenase [Candidatus Sulfotelmatobacter sp.]|nr:2OG-Fe(II) oxygenase [Candidatus Sulfotelmatobacter sp.]
MTSKQILDAFSETLMQDERILSPRERELLMSLLQNAKDASSNPETQSAVTAAIARSVGETVAQRAFTLLGSSIVEQIVARGAASGANEETMPATVFAGPKPPGPGGPQPPSGPHDIPGPHPPGPGPQPPSGPPGIDLRHATAVGRQEAQKSQPASNSGVAVLETPAVVRARCVVLDEFLAPQEVEELIRYTQEHESEFRNSEVISPSGESGETDYSHRRSRVLMELGAHEQVILKRIRGVLPKVLEQLGIEEFPITRTEVQITASNDGDFFHAHCDDAQERIASRRMTFVYFFHREPSQFEGGELRLHDSRKKGDYPLGTGSYETIVPQQNQIVFFPCSILHEITPVQCRSRAFADSRFTVNGWLHQ